MVPCVLWVFFHQVVSTRQLCYSAALDFFYYFWVHTNSKIGQQMPAVSCNSSPWYQPPRRSNPLRMILRDKIKRVSRIVFFLIDDVSRNIFQVSNISICLDLYTHVTWLHCCIVQYIPGFGDERARWGHDLSMSAPFLSTEVVVSSVCVPRQRHVSKLCMQNPEYTVDHNTYIYIWGFPEIGYLQIIHL